MIRASPFPESEFIQLHSHVKPPRPSKQVRFMAEPEEAAINPRGSCLHAHVIKYDMGVSVHADRVVTLVPFGCNRFLPIEMV